MATHSLFKADPFSSISLPLHYHRNSLKDINKYEKQLIFFLLSPLLSLSDRMTLSDMLNGNHTEKEVSWLPCWDIGLPLLIPPTPPLHPCSFSSFKISGRALYQLGRCSRLFLIGWCASRAGLPLSAASLPLRSSHPTSLSEPAELRLQLDHCVSGEQETTAAGSPALMVRTSQSLRNEDV